MSRFPRLDLVDAHVVVTGGARAARPARAAYTPRIGPATDPEDTP